MKPNSGKDGPVSVDLPTMKDVYEAVGAVEDKIENKVGALEDKIEDKFVRKNEVRLWVALGLVGGQVVASLVTAYITQLSPPQQAHTAVAFLAHLL